MDSAVICAIVKQEHLYVDEWIQYHLKLGFKHIYLYDNDEEEPFEYLQDRYKDSVFVIEFHGPCKQLFAYQHFIEFYRYEYKWCAFIDLDEFIVLRKNKTITEFLNEYCPSGSIGLNWVLFGSSGHEKYENKPVLERFQKRQIGVNKHVKLIACLRDMIRFTTPHSCELLNNTHTKDTNMKIILGPFNENGDDKVAYINHYIVKSKEELEKKCSRGRPDMVNAKRTIEEFDDHDRNDIIDTFAYDFMNSKKA